MSQINSPRSHYPVKPPGKKLGFGTNDLIDGGRTTTGRISDGGHASLATIT